MSNASTKNSELSSGQIDSENRIDSETINKIKPFISHCLTLNHDINNPLTGVIGYTEYILSEPEGLTDDHKDLLQRIMKCAERIQRLVAELGDEKAALAKEIDIKKLIEAGSD